MFGGETALGDVYKGLLRGDKALELAAHLTAAGEGRHM